MTYTQIGIQMSATSILSVRVSPDEKNLLKEAAEQSRSTVAEFMRRKALEGAEMELMERRIVQISADKWEAFEAMLAEPARENPHLKELAQRTPVWER